MLPKKHVLFHLVIQYINDKTNLHIFLKHTKTLFRTHVLHNDNIYLSS